MSIEKIERNELHPEDVLQKDKDKHEDKEKTKHHVLGMYQDKPVVLKKGKYGIYTIWNEKPLTLKALGNRPMENIKLEEVIPLLENPSIMREISENISIRTSKNGPYVFYKTKKMKRPLFYKLDGLPEPLETMETEQIKAWIIETHKIR